MKIINPQLSGSVYASGSFVLPSGTADQRPTSPPSGSLFFEISDSGSNLVVYNGSGSNGWETVGKQTTPVFQALPVDIEYLLVAGGGGGGSYGGGGAGGYLSSSLSSVTSGSSFTITVGSGGAGASDYNSPGAVGVDSTIVGDSISTITSLGGGYGGDNTGTTTAEQAGDGGSGGGGSDGEGATPVSPNIDGGSGTVGQGNDGGDGTFNGGSVVYVGGGGGGAGSTGADATTSAAGAGGDGLASTITGTSITRAGGGGGVTYNSNASQATGGDGGGGNGGTWNATTGTSTPLPNSSGGSVNTGGGGGATNPGGSGVAIFAYDSGSLNTAGGIVGDAGNGRKYHQFNSSGTFKVGSTSDFSIVTDSLVAHFDAGNFNSRGTSTWTDMINAQNASVANASLGNNFYYSLDGTGDIFTVSSPTQVNSSLNSGHTWEMWVYPTSTSAEDIVGSWAIPSTNAPGDFLYMVYQNKFRPHYITSTTTLSFDTSTSISANTWTHLIATVDFSNNIMKAFINSTQDATTKAITGAGSTSTDAFYIGSRDSNSGGANFTGRIAQVRYYSKVLTDAEILQNYNATKTNFV